MKDPTRETGAASSPAAETLQCHQENLSAQRSLCKQGIKIFPLDVSMHLLSFARNIVTPVCGSVWPLVSHLFSCPGQSLCGACRDDYRLRHELAKRGWCSVSKLCRKSLIVTAFSHAQPSGGQGREPLLPGQIQEPSIPGKTRVPSCSHTLMPLSCTPTWPLSRTLQQLTAVLDTLKKVALVSPDVLFVSSCFGFLVLT